jgi:hypothetical protein
MIGATPNEPGAGLDGVWTARGIGHTGQTFTMRLQQSGDTVSGMACETDGGILVFRDAPVRGDYPRVRFAVSPAGPSFSGRQDDTHDIVGTYSDGFDLRFTRGGSAAGC